MLTHEGRCGTCRGGAFELKAPKPHECTIDCTTDRIRKGRGWGSSLCEVNKVASLLVDRCIS